MKVLVTGANGFIGRVLCDELIKHGHAVRAAVRSSTGADNADCEIVKISNINSETNWADALRNVSTVIHLAARVHVMHDKASDPLEEFRRVNVAGTLHLARSAAASGVKRLVYVSSIKVNGEETRGEVKFTELDEPSPQDPYGISKCEAEQALRLVAQETGLELVIVRPPLVYGPGVKGNFAHMLNMLAKRIPLPLASVNNLRSLVYVGNIADALIVCSIHPSAVGQTYLISDGDDISTPELLRQLSIAQGHVARLLPCPPIFLRLAGTLLGKSSQIERLLGSLRVNSDKIQKELDWVPPYRLQEGLRRTGEASVGHDRENGMSDERREPQ